MRKWIVGISAASVLLSAASLASAQLRRNRGYQQPYQGQFYEDQYGPYQQGYGPQYQQAGPQYQQAGPQSQSYGRQPRMANRPYDQGQMGPGAGIPQTDRELAAWLLVDNRAEIQLARLAQDRASCDDVKDFAKKVLDDHAKIVEQLQRFAGMGRQQPSGGNRGGMQPGGLNLVRLKQQLGQQCLASAQRELEGKEGDEFDKCYIGMQLAMHMEMLDTLKVFSRYASPEFDEVIEQGEQITQDHLDHAKDLIKQLEKDQKSDESGHQSHRSSSSE